jgi:hypothetical protein
LLRRSSSFTLKIYTVNNVYIFVERHIEGIILVHEPPPLGLGGVLYGDPRLLDESDGKYSLPPVFLISPSFYLC